MMLCMISSKEFTQLTYQQKKQTLIVMFSQLNDTEISFDDTIFLLNASNKILENTLDKIYVQLWDILKNEKNMSHNKYLERIKKIEAEIKADTDKESEEADALLDNI